MIFFGRIVFCKSHKNSTDLIINKIDDLRPLTDYVGGDSGALVQCVTEKGP